MTNEKDRELVEAVAMPWICVEEKPCEETVAVHWEELLTALSTRFATVRKEEREAAFKESLQIVMHRGIAVPKCALCKDEMNYAEGFDHVPAHWFCAAHGGQLVLDSHVTDWRSSIAAALEAKFTEKGQG